MSDVTFEQRFYLSWDGKEPRGEHALRFVRAEIKRALAEQRATDIQLLRQLALDGAADFLLEEDALRASKEG
jgi:hypothetical protein